MSIWAFALFTAVLSTSDGKLLAIQPLGTVSRRDLDGVALRLRQTYGFRVEILPKIGLPKQSWYPPRKRYRAERILDYLDGRREAEFELGVPRSDISTSSAPYRDWGVIGLGRQPGHVAVISSFRLRANGKVSPLERLERVAEHETGHMLGLAHCPNPKCVMNGLSSHISAIDNAPTLCDECRRRLSGSIKLTNEGPR